MSAIKSRQLKQNRGKKAPTEFIFVDVETKQVVINENRTEQRLWFGWGLYWRRRTDRIKDDMDYKLFQTTDEFWEWCLSKTRNKQTLHIIAHNALFDLTVLKFITTLTKKGYECSFIFDEGLTFISKWKLGGRRLMFLDNTNWFRGKLALWGASLDLPKLVMPGKEDSLDNWLEYCKRDTEILYHLQVWLLKFLVDNDLGAWKFTLSSLAFNAYRHRFMEHKIYIPQETKESDLARQCYYGGRTEALYSGEDWGKDFYKVDVNSMYPYVMSDRFYPTELYGYSSKPELSRLYKHFHRYLFCGRFIVNTTEPYFPQKRDKKTFYPVGEFECFLTTPEIQKCIENNWLVDVLELSWYRGERVFGSYVDVFYGKKLEAGKVNDKLSYLFYKLYLNGLYGKFGQRNYDDSIIGKQALGTFETSFFINAETGERGVIRQIGENVIRSVKSGEGYNSFVAIAAHVTAYARLYLYDMVLTAGRENVYYMDTDSLILNDTGYQRLEHLLDDEEIGKLKLEDFSRYLAVIAPKHYYFGGKVTRKGVRKTAVKVGDNRYKQEVWPRLNRLLDQEKEVYYNYSVTKNLRAAVTSGIITSGGSVEPYELNSIDAGSDERKE